MKSIYFLRCEAPGGAVPVVAVDTAIGDLLVRLGERAPSGARRAFRLTAKATRLHVIAAAAEVGLAVVTPLGRFSSGAYSEEDVVADLELEDADIGLASGREARKQVARNLAAWQEPDVVVQAIDVALRALDVERVGALLFADDDAVTDPSDLLCQWRAAIVAATAAGARRICLEVLPE